MKKINAKIIISGIAALLSLSCVLYLTGVYFAFWKNPKINPSQYSWTEYQLKRACQDIDKGMQKSEVINRIGIPDGKEGVCWYWYSLKRTCTKEYYELSVSFSNNIVVEARFEEFCWE